MKLSQEQIDRIYKISDWCVKGIILIGLVVIFLKPGNWFWWVFFIMLSISMIVNAVSRHFATDEEKAERKEEIKEAMQELHEEEAQKKRKKPSTIPSPLIDLTEGQEKIVVRLLNYNVREISGHLKTADLKNMLHALAEKGDLDDSNLELLVDWVENVTGKTVVEDKFKNEYNDPYRRNGKQESKWEKRIREEFDKLR